MRKKESFSELTLSKLRKPRPPGLAQEDLLGEGAEGEEIQLLELDRDLEVLATIIVSSVRNVSHFHFASPLLDTHSTTSQTN